MEKEILEEKKINCWYCGSEIAKKDKYCKVCGKEQSQKARFPYTKLGIIVTSLFIGPFVLKKAMTSPLLTKKERTKFSATLIIVMAIILFFIMKAINVIGNYYVQMFSY